MRIGELLQRGRARVGGPDPTAPLSLSGARSPAARSDGPLIDVEDLVVEYPIGAGERVRAVDGVSFEVRRGETFGLVGESGCGKSSTGRTLTCLIRPAGGHVRFDGVDMGRLGDHDLRQMRRRMQNIFQDPVSSLNPRRAAKDIIGEPLKIWSKQLGIDSSSYDQRVSDMMSSVGLNFQAQAKRRAHSFSGGQCQRISIARALMLNPDLLVCDEPVSALDVSVQAQILNLLEEMKRQYGLTMVFISHDLAVVKHVSDRVAVMYLGRLCEVGTADAIYRTPAHPYTAALLSSITTEGEVPAKMAGEMPSALHPPSGCRFRTRCPKATDVCAEVAPPMVLVGPDHSAACHHPNVPVTISSGPGSGGPGPSGQPQARAE